MIANEKGPKVSVCVVTYNQEKYVGKCLQSIVDQQTDFSFEVIVGDDCSTDGTRAIVMGFAEKYPDMIKPVFREKNIGPTRNYLDVHNHASGEYVAHLDGDDYCLPGKLKRLVSHLDENPECRIVWHRMIIINERGQSAIGMPVVPISNYIAGNRLYAKDLAKYYGLTGCHSGSMYRACAKKIRERDEETLDYFFTMSFLIDGGYASYIDEPYGVYRFFACENTLTRSKGCVVVGDGKLSLMRSFLKSNPELGKQFSTQCLFELLMRIYLRYPLKMDYLKMFLRCRSIPSLSDFLLIAKVFHDSRNSSLEQKFTQPNEAPLRT